MHRSGTSMIAGLLARCGWYVGSEEELLPAGEDNPAGFWERRDVVDLNDRLLERAGASWFCPLLEEPLPLERRARRLVKGLQAPWLLKDPRLIVTWEAWSDALESALVLFVYRSPMAVAASLRERHGFPLEYGLALWEFYNRGLLRAFPRDGVVPVSYEAFAGDPGEGWRKMVKALAKQGVSLPDGAGSDYFEVELDHSRRRTGCNGRLNSRQAALARFCEALCAGAEPGSLPEKSPGLEEKIRENAQAFADLAGMADLRAATATLTEERDRARSDLRTATATLTEERDRARSDFGTLSREHGELRQSREVLAAAYRADSEELSFLRVERREGEAMISDLRSVTSVLTKERDRAREELDFLRMETKERESRIAELQAEAAEVGKSYRQAQTKADYLFHRLDTTYLKLLSFMDSIPGRLVKIAGVSYKLLTFRLAVSTALDDVLEDAVQHVDLYGNRLGPAPPGRLRLGMAVAAYVLRRPVSSLRGFSWRRLARILRVFAIGERSDLERWVRRRFPDGATAAIAKVKPDLDESLDRLELDFREEEHPLVSIVLPVYNEYRMTAYCLRSLLEHSADVGYEIIVADDASTDLTASIGDRIGGVRIERGESNRGFVRNCNAGAARARGRYILFLNNDTAFTEGWLSELVAAMERDERVGIVGPMLLYGNGCLQEAGGIVWNDGSGWNYGRMDDPERPRYNYRREVDYVSGACLMIRAELWSALSGFDERFAPAYYEDTDLCFAARAAGYRVVYQPHSRVYHFEGLSHGADLSAGVKRNQVGNAVKFYDKWRDTLRAEHFPNGEQLFFARDRSRDRRTVLVVDHYVPSYDKDAGSRSAWSYLKLMVELGYNVKFVGANFFPHQPYTRELQAMGVEVLVGEEMARTLDAWLERHAPDIDAVYIHRPHVAEQMLPSFEAMDPRPRLIFFGHDLHFLRVRRESSVTGNPELEKRAQKWKARELSVFERVDKVYYPSQVEVDMIADVAPGVEAEAIPLFAMDSAGDVEYRFQDRADMLFVAGFDHPPNVDGLCWFVDEVLPLVWERCPELTLHVVGSNAPAAVRSLAGERVAIHGCLSEKELAAQYRKARMAVAPLRYGAGVKGKVLEALWHGLPLVTTPIGAEGLPEADSVLGIEDSAEGFAAALVELERGDESRLKRLRHYGGYLERHFSRERAEEVLRRDFGEPSMERKFA